VDKGRSESDKFGILMTQNYKTGQICIDSIMLESSYFDFLAEEKQKEKDEEDKQDNEEDDGDAGE
jgi:hypothetical protein